MIDMTGNGALASCTAGEFTVTRQATFMRASLQKTKCVAEEHTRMPTARSSKVCHAAVVCGRPRVSHARAGLFSQGQFVGHAAAD